MTNSIHEQLLKSPPYTLGVWSQRNYLGFRPWTGLKYTEFGAEVKWIWGKRQWKLSTFHEQVERKMPKNWVFVHSVGFFYFAIEVSSILLRTSYSASFFVTFPPNNHPRALTFQQCEEHYNHIGKPLHPVFKSDLVIRKQSILRNNIISPVFKTIFEIYLGENSRYSLNFYTWMG